MSNELTTEEALVLSAGCQGNPERTHSVHVINRTNAAIKICFFQVKSNFNSLPSGYIKDTGVFVGGTNLAPSQNCDADPCLTGAVNRGPILGNVFSGSLKALENGYEQTINFPVTTIAPPEYYSAYGWTLNYHRDSRHDGSAPVYELTPSILVASM